MARTKAPSRPENRMGPAAKKSKTKPAPLKSRRDETIALAGARSPSEAAFIRRDKRLASSPEQP